MAINIPIITEFNGKGIAKARKEFEQLEGAGAKAGFVIKKAMIPATAALGALAAGAFDAAKGAMEDEAAQKELARSLRQTTGATNKIIDANEEWIATQGRLLGITDDELRPAISKLARGTRDVTKAQKLATQAMDIAAATGKPLEAVTDALTRALGGNLNALARLAPEFRDMVKDGKSFDEIMGEMAKTMGGAATEAANTAEGRFKRLKVSMDETKESIGASLIPVIEAGLPILEKFADWAQENPDTFRNIATAIGAIAAATVALNLAMAVNPFVLLVAAGVALGYAIDKVLEKLSEMDNMFGRMAGKLRSGKYGVLGSLLFPDLGKPQVNPGAGVGGLGGGRMAELKGVPAMAAGGVVTGPTLALIGEAGPEAVIPLDRMGSMGGDTTVNINVHGGDPNAVVDALRRYMRQNGGVPIRISSAF